MKEQEIKNIIDNTCTAMVLKLKAAGLLESQQRSAYEKTEALLYQYSALKKVAQPYARRVVDEIDACLEDLKNEPYIQVIELFYFEGLKNAACARELNCDERTCRRNRRALVEKMTSRLASEDFIRELLL